MTHEYQAFLLRLERDVDQQRWRILLQDVQSGEVRRFVGKRELLGYLFGILNQPDMVDSAESDPTQSPHQPLA
ncbi:MAG: hypothetical protein M9928_18210 [Anaerolineae bacterium]|nr:hypothetical protein [Anaerolineae bacterium]MCO5199498.1 hypothetical protein [Anaerolineae bacterium]MCO5206949.1 hypothetical protein [Anaerolineae bacterium]